MPAPTRTTEPDRVAAPLIACQAEAKEQLAQGAPLEASRTYERLLTAALDHAADWALSNPLHKAVQGAVAGLGDCLPGLEEDAAARRAAFEALFRVYGADARYGANGLTQEIPFVLLQHAHPPERQELMDRVRREIAAGAGPELAEAYWRLLLDLATPDPQQLLRLLNECLAAGFPALAAEKLLDLDRVGEALLTAREHLPETEDLLRFAGSPAAHSQVRPIMALVAERLAKSFDPQLADWLAARYAERGELPRALELRVKLLNTSPGGGDYDLARGLAQRLGTWDRLRPQLRRELEGRHTPQAEAEIAFGEGDPATALQLVRLSPAQFEPRFVTRLAEHAADSAPEAALELYRYLAEASLAQSGRERLRQAASYLRRLREVYLRLGRQAEWETYAADVQNRHGARPGFGREMRQAGVR